MTLRLTLGYFVMLAGLVGVITLSPEYGWVWVLVVAVLGTLLNRFVTSPLRQLVAATERIGPDSLSERVPEQGTAEVRELSRSFNRMADRLQDTVQSLRASEAQRREFLADVSHNLGTPLAASIGWVQAILDGMVTDPAEQRAQLERIQRELVFVSRSVQRLLELSRWESQEPEVHRGRFPLVDPLMEVVETLEEAASSRNVKLEFETLDSRVEVEGDRGRVRDVLQILLENAVLHAGRDTTVWLKCMPRDGRLVVEIRDNGRGIAREQIQDMRKGFRRASGRSTGLGLAIADRLARAHGGQLDIESEAGKGTTVRFSLKLVG